MSGAFGYEETEDLDGKETYEFLVKDMGMEPDEAKDRTKQQGKDPSGKKDKKSEYYKDPNFITRATLSEIQKQKAIKVVEDMLAKKKDSADLSKKDSSKDTESLSPVLKKNLSSLIKQAEKHGFSKKDLIKIIQSE
jgi:DNA-binding transcriptional regulator YhcF (GntR family)